MPRKKETITLSIPPGTKEQLEAIARRLNIFWGKEPSVSGLIVAIAQQQLEVGQGFTLNRVQVDSLKQASNLLVDSGQLRDAQILIGLLLERGNLETSERQALLQQVSQPTEAWRILVDDYKSKRQPFRLFYHDAQERDLEYTVRYAEISFEEKRFYLNIWCEETDDIPNPEYPELIHNRCLRLDRIKTILPISGHWREEGLDYLEVYLHFYRGLVKGYEPREGKDMSDRFGAGVRHVVRRVSNPFWLIREVLRYGEDCEIISPENVRDRIKEKLLSQCQRYGLNVQNP
ncbi:MAG: WYL domain-containing protein [Nostocaceae cyanobacterium]|nr:WYL domain-containing protein [Nostocaceae cyanobacterium]